MFYKYVTYNLIVSDFFADYLCIKYFLFRGNNSAWNSMVYCCPHMFFTFKIKYVAIGNIVFVSLLNLPKYHTFINTINSSNYFFLN